MALTGISDDFDLDDLGILRDSAAAEDLLIDDDGILHDSINIFSHVARTGGHGTDSGFAGDKQSSTSTLQHLQVSFDEELPPIGDESVNISDFEASRDDLDSVGVDIDGYRGVKSKSYRKSRAVSLEVDTPGSTLEHPQDLKGQLLPHQRQRGPKENRSEDKGLFTNEYYQQLKELGVLVDGVDFSKDDSLDVTDALEGQMSQEPVDDYDNRDLIGEYLQNQYDRELAEQEETESHSRMKSYEMSEAQTGRHSRASSAPTISGRSFPEILPEDAPAMLSESQHTENDDEIFLINNQLLPGSSKLQAQKLPVTPSAQGSRPSSRVSSLGSRSNTPQSVDIRGREGSLRHPMQNHLQRPGSRQRQSPYNSRSELHEEQVLSRSETNTPLRKRTDSMTSETVSSASPSKSTISKARSQESFFEQERQQAASGEKGHKRLLPTPSISEPNESFKIRSKSKSVSNISQRSGPVKPTHMSISEIERMTSEEGGIGIGERSDEMLKKLEGELSTQLKQESVRRKQATELVQQLQKEYDMLLSKYALAELTIDQMRLGARITLHTSSPTPASAHPGQVSSGAGAHKGQMVQLAPPAAQKAVLGHFTITPDGTRPLPRSAGATDGSQHAQSGSQTEKPVSYGATSFGIGEEDSRQGDPILRTENRVTNRASMPPETVKVNLQAQAVSLDDRLSHFFTLLEQQQLTLEEQQQAFDNICADHDKLRRTYLQVKEDYNVLRRSGASLPNTEFDGDKELEGQLFRLGLKFDEVHEQVESNLKEKSMRRQPFQANRQTDQDDENSDDGSNMDNQDPNWGGEQARDGAQTALSETGDDPQFEKRAEQLHDEYRALTDRYRRLKQMTETPEREKEIDNLVRKLKDICNEMPDMFRLPPELQERFEKWKKNERLKLYNKMNSVWERLQMREQRRSPVSSSGKQKPQQQQQKRGDGAFGGTVPPRGMAGSRSTSPALKGRGTPVVGDHKIGAYLHDQRSSRDAGGDDSFRRPSSSLAGSRSSMASPRDVESTAVHSSVGSSPRSHNHSRDRMSPSSMDGAAAPRDNHSWDPHMPRPQRHKHGFRDPKLSKHPDRGSYSSLPDSGISDQEQHTKDRHHDDALANLPGPGKFKQMTRQRGADDVDSGFVGSVVGSEVLQNQSHDQAERPLRLQDRRTDQNANRSLDSSASTSTVENSMQSSTKHELSSKHYSSTAATTSARSMSQSTDRSYDAELDESTVSEVRTQGAQPKDVRPKERLSGQQGRQQLLDHLLSQKSDVRAESSLESRSFHEETVEDSKIDDSEDFSGSGHKGSAVKVNKSAESTTEQHIQSSHHQPTSVRPPTPHRSPTPHRPPTPYQQEQSKEETAKHADQMRDRVQVTEASGSRVSSEDEVRSTSERRQIFPSGTSVLSSQPQQQRPESRGEPTTDLYHTRGQTRHGHNRNKVTSESSRASSYEARQASQQRGAQADDNGMSTDTDIRSDATRSSSVNSSRLRALQEEIERLKEGVKQANEKASLPPQFLSAPPPPERQDPEYYDPFDDPYGFMRMPRRRANSFSGGRVRDYDEWYWALPKERRNEDGDIPLGFAAADSYNRRAQGHKEAREGAQHRLKHRLERRRAGYTQPKTVEGGVGVAVSAEAAAAGSMSDPQVQAAAPSQTTRPTPLRGRPPPHIADPQALFNYYVPTRNSVQAPVGHPPSSAAGNPYSAYTVRSASSQPHLASGQTSTVGYHQQSGTPDLQQTSSKQPWYTIRRAPRPASNGEYVPAYGHQNPATMGHHQTVPASPYTPAQGYYAAYPVAGAATPAQGTTGQGYWTEVCPLCGGMGGHIHEEDVEPVYGYTSDDFATDGEYRGRTRQRSKHRSRRRTPERSSSQNGYLVREYSESASEGSDVEGAKFHRRNRSTSRSRSQSETRSSSRHRHGRRYRRRSRSGLYDSDGNVDLNESLVLSEDISRLTNRMLGTVHGELAKARRKQEFGSSYW